MLGDEQFAARERVGGARAARARRDRRRARALRRLRALRRGRAVLGDRRGRRCATAPTSSSRATSSRRRSRSGRRSRSASTRRSIWERERGWFTTEPFSEPEVFEFPEGIGAGRVRERRARGGRADPALGRLPAGDVQVRARRGVHRGAADAAQARARLDRAGARARRRGRAARRRRRGAARPGDARRPDDRQDVRGHLVTGIGKDGEPRATYLYHVVDNEQTMREYGHQAVVLQTAMNPVVALELLATGAWRARACSAPRRSRRRRSSSCSPTTARRTEATSGNCDPPSSRSRLGRPQRPRGEAWNPARKPRGG